MNKTILIGRLTKDIDLRKSQNGHSYAKFILAVNRRFKKENEQSADFISCTVIGKQADNMYQYLRKGSQVAIEGRIETGSYEKNGQRIYTTDVVVERVDFLDTRKDSQSNGVSRDVHSNGNFLSDFESQYTEENEPILEINDQDLPF